MSLPFSPYLSQLLTKLLETLTSLQGIIISIYIWNFCEVILPLVGTINFTTKNPLQPVWTGSFRVVDRLGLVFKGPVAVPEYLKRSGEKLDLTGLENTTSINDNEHALHITGCHVMQPPTKYPRHPNITATQSTTCARRQ